MKTTVSILAMAFVFVACNDSKTSDVEMVKQHIMDSVNAANAVNRAVDSVNQLANSVNAGIETSSMTINTQGGVATVHQAQSHNTPHSQTNVQTVSSTKSPVANAPSDNTVTNATTTTTKKKMNSKTKGALIGAAAGAVTGAAAGAVLDKNNRGAEIGRAHV